MKVLSILLAVSASVGVANASLICKSGVDLVSPETDMAPNPYYAQEYKRKMESYQTITDFKYFNDEQDRFLDTKSLVGFPRPDMTKSIYLIDILSGQNIDPTTWEYCYMSEDLSMHFLKFTDHLKTRTMSFAASDYKLNTYSKVAVNYAPVGGKTVKNEDPIYYYSDDNIVKGDKIHYQDNDNIRKDDPVNYGNDRDIHARARAERKQAIDNLGYRHDRDIEAKRKNDVFSYYDRSETNDDSCVDPLGYGKRKRKGCK